MARLQVGTENGLPIELHYEDVGSGKPVVLIHGWPLSGRSWEKQVPALVEAGYRVITYDRRGFGSSSQPWYGYDYDTFAADLHALLEHIDVQQATLVGFSMGGGEVARYIGTYGTSRLAGAVLAGAVTPYLYKADDNPEGGMDDESIRDMEQGVQRDRLAFLEDFTYNFFTANDELLVSESFRRYSKHIASFASPKGTVDCIGAFSRTDFREDLKRFDVKTLILHGDADAIVPLEVSGQRAHEAIENSELVVIEGAPHGFNVTHATAFNEALLRFLA